MNEKLKLLIKNGQVYSSLYKNGLSNHLPMALIALDKMGAEEEKLDKFYNTYVKKLELASPYDPDLKISKIQDHLSRPKSFLNLVNFFDVEIKKNGVAYTINKYTSLLCKGISSATFHPLIRIAYAIEAEFDDEISHALASWVVSYQELGGHEVVAPYLNLEESLNFLKSEFAKNNFNTSGNAVFFRMKSVSEHNSFKFFLNSINEENLLLEDMANLAINLYLSTDDNFSALHAVTSVHALRLVLTYVDNPSAVLRYFWQAMGAVYLEISAPDLLSNFNVNKLENWDKIESVAKNSMNDHVIKFIYTCKSEFLHYKNPSYHLAACLKAGLLDNKNKFK